MAKTYEVAEGGKSELSILLLAPSGRDAELSSRLLHGEGLSCHACTSFADMAGRLKQGFGAGAVVIAEEALINGEAADLLKLLAGQPGWSDLPLVLLTRRTAMDRHCRPLAVLRNASVLRRPVHIATFLSVLRSAVEARKRQYELRDFIDEMQALNLRLEQRAGQLQRLALQLTESEERTRRYIAEIIHNDLQQLLVGVKLRLGIVLNRAASEAISVDSVRELETLVGEAIEKARNLSHEIRPPSLRYSGLIPSLRWLGEQLGETHGLRVDIDASPHAEPRDEPLKIFLFRAVQELLLNTVKHAGTDSAKLRVRKLNQEIEILVQDEGRGFNTRILDAPYDRIKGFGLFSISERAELLGGRLEVQSTPGGGSSFRLFLPYRADTAREGIPEKATDTAALQRRLRTGRRMRVALADDHKVVREGMKLLLNGEPGIEVVAEAADGVQAIEIADRFHPDLMIMDVAMPEMDGVEATRRIKARHPDIRIIGLSMLEDEEIRRKIMEAGAEAYLSKSRAGSALLMAILSGCVQGGEGED
jgi:signal transduction histidine kinase/CheY-like chemotaxis protein